MADVNVLEKYRAELRNLNIDKALSISNAASLRCWEDLYSRLYYGSEFCEKLSLNKPQLEKILQFVQAHKIPFTFVTGCFSSDGIVQLQEIIESFFKRHCLTDLEIVVNDWGLLEIFKGIDCRLLLGRLLAKQKCDPRISSIQFNDLSKTVQDLKRPDINEGIRPLLKEHHIGRIELDHPFQGLDLQGLSDLRVSLNWPYGYLSMSRLCSYFYLKNNTKPRIRTDCQEECRKDYLTLTQEEMKTNIFVQGKAFIFQNDVLETEFFEKNKNVDRIVVRPHLLA